LELQDRVAIVTGGAIRLGAAISRALAEREARVAVQYHRSADAAASLVREIEGAGGEALAVAGDVSRAEDVQRLVEATLTRFGQIDVLVNNAGIFFETPFPELSEEDWDRTLAVNLKGPFLCARAVAPGMLAQQRGKIVNIADIAAMRPWPRYLPYSVSKAGVVALTQGLARALAPHVQVNAVAPGPVLLPEAFTPEQREQALRNVPLGRAGSAEDIARTVLFLIEGPDYITGAVIPVDGGRSIV
jgi:NAD(P)-dependent dehydrogenase (short-subunit alcohol dehydrogenase family)